MEEGEKPRRARGRYGLRRPVLVPFCEKFRFHWATPAEIEWVVCFSIAFLGGTVSF